MRRGEPVYLYNARPYSYTEGPTPSVKKEEYVAIEQFEQLKGLVEDFMTSVQNFSQETVKEVSGLKYSVAMLEKHIDALQSQPIAPKGGAARIVIKKGRNTVNIVTR